MRRFAQVGISAAGTYLTYRAASTKTGFKPEADIGAPVPPGLVWIL